MDVEPSCVRLEHPSRDPPLFPIGADDEGVFLPAADLAPVHGHDLPVARVVPIVNFLFLLL